MTAVQVARITDLDVYRILPDTALRTVMERLNSAELLYKCLLVSDAHGRLLGTVTDGDIRRGILRGVGLSDPVAQCMRDQPIVGRVGADAENQEKLRDFVAHIAFLPVVDANRMVREVIVWTQDRPDVIALVMAGGLGKRLGERTRTRPKPLLPVGGKPILGHILDRVESASIVQVYVSAYYLADQICEFVAGRRGSAAIEILRETDPLGTAGAIGLLPDPMTRPFMVINGDILTKLDFHALREFHQRHGKDATIAVAQHEVTVPFGVVRTGPDGQFHGIDEKPTLTHFVAAGIYLLSPEYRSLVAAGEHLDMPVLLERGRSIGLQAGLFPIHEYWTDVGRPEDLETARLIENAGRI